METPAGKSLYIPANVALWLLIESGADEASPDAVYLRGLGDELVLIQEDEDPIDNR